MENSTTKPFYNTTIPSDWEVKELKDVCKKITDGTHDTPKQTDDGVPFLTAIHVKEDLIDFDNCYFLPEHTHREIYRRCNPEKNDVLMVNIGAGVATTALVNVDYEFSLKNVALLKPNRKHIIGSYLNYYQVYIKPRLTQSLLNGGAQPFLSLKQIQKLQVVLPPLPEQRAIAHVFSLMDTAINQNNQLIAQKELRKKWLMQNLLTGKKRLKGFDGVWKKLGAGEVFKSISIKGFEDEELLSATQDRGIIPRTMLDGRVTMPDGTTSGYKLVEPGDFVISLRSFQGGLEYSYYRGIVSPAYIVLKPKKKINDEFYKQYYKSYEFIGRLATAVIGIRDGKQVSYDDYCIVKIPYPSFEEQTAIAQVLQAADKEIQLLKVKTDKLREQKRGMMQVLLTGKKRLKINT
jgi:type I restriction enzyme S subunit